MEKLSILYSDNETYLSKKKIKCLFVIQDRYKVQDETKALLK